MPLWAILLAPPVFFGLYKKLKGMGKYCTDCGKEFGLTQWINKCVCCDKLICSSCTYELPKLKKILDIKGKFCKECWESYNEALENYDKVILYYSNFKGIVPIEKNSEKATITTSQYEDKAEAEDHLKIEAARLGCDLVYNVALTKDSRSYEKEIYYNPKTDASSYRTYFYNVWRATGISGKRKNGI